jgi:Transposase and inactivated derivatives, IS30 family
VAAGEQREHERALRDYFPKGTDLSVVTDEDLQQITAEINDRPRKTLDWNRPGDLFNSALADAV